MAEPREVTVSCERERRDNAVGQRRFFAKSFTPKSHPPLLHVCRESHFEALSIYKPFFKTENSPKHTYISFERDTLRCSDTILTYIGVEEVSSVERLVLDISDAMYFGHFHMESVMRMRKMTDLTLLVTEKGIRPTWDSRTRYLEKVARDFLEAKYTDPAWECPRVLVMSADNGEELSVIKAGALIPGWKQG